MPFRQAASQTCANLCTHNNLAERILPGTRNGREVVRWPAPTSTRFAAMSYTILGRAIKTEYLALGTLLSTVGLSYVAASGGSKEASSGSKKTLQEVKDSVKFDSSSKEEEELAESIKNFVAEAEKDSKH
ncbi:hypothetical protein V8E53_014938 [Lactarius tabidus]